MSIITLTTDLGYQDYYLAKLKSSILKHMPQTHFLDVNHEIAYHDIQFAAYSLMSIWRDLPKGSIHIVSVYNYYSSNNEYIAFSREGHFFIGPNNGVFTLLFEDLSQTETHKISGEFKNYFGLFAHASALLSTGAPLNDVGPLIDKLKEKINILPVYTSNEIRATIMHVDRYGNAVLNIKKEFFNNNRKERPFEIYFKNSDPITSIHDNYSKVQIGEVIATFNMNDFLEIGINMGNASTLLDLYTNGTIQIHFKD